MVNNVSVIIPAYNADRYICEAIDSLTAQGYENLEIIVIDDGSTDSTEKAIAHLVGNGVIKYFYKKNGGVSSARNLGLEKARGEFIGFLDADDTYLPGMISSCLKELVEKQYDLVSVDNYMVFYENSQEIRRDYQGYNWIEVESSSLYCNLLRVGGIGGPHKAIFRKTVFDKIGYFDTKLPMYEDLDLWIRIAQQGLQWGHIRQALIQYNHRGSGSSLSTQSSKRNDQGRLSVIRKHKNDALKICPHLRKDIGDQLWNIGRSYLLEYQSYREGFSCLLESIMTDPNWQRVSGSIHNQLCGWLSRRIKNKDN